MIVGRVITHVEVSGRVVFIDGDVPPPSTCRDKDQTSCRVSNLQTFVFEFALKINLLASVELSCPLGFL